MQLCKCTHSFWSMQKHGSAMTSSSLAHSERSCLQYDTLNMCILLYIPDHANQAVKILVIFLTNITSENQLTAKYQCRVVLSLFLFFILHQRHQKLCEILCFYFWNNFGIPKFLKWKELQNCLKIINLRAHVSH